MHKEECDEETFNEAKAEIRDEIAKLERDAEKYEEDNAEIEDVLMNIAEIAANLSFFLKSPIIQQKKDILGLVLSNCKTEGKKLCFSITKSLDQLVKTAETDKWCASLSNYRTDGETDWAELARKIEIFKENMEFVTKN